MFVLGLVSISEADQLKICSRVATLEQELGSAKDKAALLTRENRDLQEELSEIYRLKVLSSLKQECDVFLRIKSFVTYFALK